MHSEARQSPLVYSPVIGEAIGEAIADLRPPFCDRYKVQGERYEQGA